ncbi:MAG: chorismate mutase [Symploca sp. SIO3C6]|uniref:Chorismate mutase n=1 Tax=Symploca sp. SIO1C4 TaxID=2607765 RepID=A0A6B3NBI4_9CYAN|nr:chorismate mutase [Symploca sp. SIO3C6]NER29037.1 chorismate mutase [Symploca sp. SIO1C4]
MKDIKYFRQEIDILDETLVKILVKRFDICRQVGIYKKKVGMPVMQPERVKAVKEKCAKLGEKHGINPDFLRQLYELIIFETCQLEEQLFQDFNIREKSATNSSKNGERDSLLVESMRQNSC